MLARKTTVAMRSAFFLKRFHSTITRDLPKQLRIGSLNLRCFDTTVQKIATAIQRDAPPLDVLGLQEVAMTWDHKIGELADLLGMRVATTAEGGWTRGLHCALLVSKEAEVTAHKPCTMMVGGRTHRCAVAVKLGPSMPHVICTHLDHSGEENRLSQLEQLRLHAKSTWGCIEAEPMLLLGDFNALRRADYTDEQWDELVTRRFNNGIESETEVTDTLERPAHESEGWGWSDCRDVALRSGGTVTGELATSVYGARVDYIYASPALLREWTVLEVSHVDVARMHGVGAFTDHALVTCTLQPRLAPSSSTPLAQEVIEHFPSSSSTVDDLQLRIRGERQTMAIWRLGADARAARDAACAADRHRSKRALAWLHIPKAGSSLGTTLVHQANSSLPPNAQMPSCAHGGTLLKPEMPRSHLHCPGWPQSFTENCTRRVAERCLLGQPELTFHIRFPLDDWFKCSFWEKSRGNVGGHEPIDEATYERFQGRFVGMFRKPERRAVSAYLWYASEFYHEGLALPNASDYAYRLRGTAARMLSGQADGEVCNSGYRYDERCPNNKQSLIPDMHTALKRLSDSFAFVGLTDQWALSICLFHAIFGGPCLPVEFENSRPTTSRTTRMPWLRNQTVEYERAFTTAVSDAVAAVADPWDGAIFEAAEARFLKDVAAHGLTPERCEKICPEGVSWRHVPPAMMNFHLPK